MITLNVVPMVNNSGILIIVCGFVIITIIISLLIGLNLRWQYLLIKKEREEQSKKEKFQREEAKRKQTITDDDAVKELNAIYQRLASNKPIIENEIMHEILISIKNYYIQKLTERPECNKSVEK